MKKIIVISPHPDDESLGCGGTILKHKESGDSVYWLIMTNILVEDGYDELTVKTRQMEIDTVASNYQFKSTIKLDFPTTKLDVLPKGQLVKAVSNVIDKIAPEVVYLPNRNDVHSDHKITFDTVISSTKTFRCPFIKKLLSYEVVSETEFTPSLQNNAFVPNCFSDVSGYFAKKISIVKMYKGEIEEHPFPRSEDNLRALATFRGATAGVKYAEAFMSLKEIW